MAEIPNGIPYFAHKALVLQDRVGAGPQTALLPLQLFAYLVHSWHHPDAWQKQAITLRLLHAGTHGTLSCLL